jgi:hypothetical protein
MNSEPTTAEITNDLLDNKEVNTAALKFKNGVVISKRIVNAMSKKSVQRVYNAVVEFPLGDAYPKFRDKREQELFNLTLELITAKNTMIQAVMEEQKRLADLAPKPIETNNEGVING